MGLGIKIFEKSHELQFDFFYTIANSGFTVYKSVPFGPLTEVLPYLSRRAAENRVVLSGARKEQQLLKAELGRRMKMKQ